MKCSAVAALTLLLGAASGAVAARPRVGFGRGLMQKYRFTTIDDPKDLTFNQLLGINNMGTIAGYFGNGSLPAHPNKGYVHVQGRFIDENFPNSVQTQVTGINQNGQTCGFWADANGNNFGWTNLNGEFKTWINPKTTGTVNQLLGLNDNGMAVGFYSDVAGINHGYTLNYHSGKFHAVKPPNAVSTTATGINEGGSVSGFFTDAGGNTLSFLFQNDQFTIFSFPGSTNTQALGVNDNGRVVGVYVDGQNQMHGFRVKDLGYGTPQFQSIDDPNGVGTTTINGLNDKGAMVGFYVDGAGNTHGMLIEKAT